MLCNKCGKQIDDSIGICAACGAIADSGDEKLKKTEPGEGTANTNAPQQNVVIIKKPVVFTKYIKIAIAAVFVISLTIAAYQFKAFFSGPLKIEKNTELKMFNLQQQIESIGELATLEYNYSTLIRMKDSRSLKNWNIPLTQKSFIIVVDGTMKIGIDASKIDVDVSETSKTISITIPKAKVLSHELHEDTLEVLEESSGLFNRVSIEDWPAMAIAKKQEMEDKVSDNDVFTRAGNDAAKMLKSLITGVVPEDYTVNVNWKLT